MRRRRCWTAAKRQRAREKADASLRRRRVLVAQVQGRQDTAFAGYLPAVQYMRKKLKIRENLRGNLHMVKGRNAEFQPEDEAMAVLGRQMLGVARRENLDHLLPEQAIADAMGIKRWPSGDTERRFLVRFDARGLRGLDRIRERMVLREVQGGQEPVHVDGDVTGLISQAEKREGVASGYMGGPIKPGFQNPRVGVEGLPFWVDLRPGNDGCEDLFEHEMAVVRKVRRARPQRWIYATLDSKYGKRKNIAATCRYGHRDRRFRFFIGGSIQYCQRKWWEQAVAVETGSWRRVSKTTEIKDLGVQSPWGPKGPQTRVVATRKEDWKEKHRAKKKKGKAPLEAKYRHQVIYALPVGPKMSAREIFREYHRGQRREFDIKDGKQSFEIRKLPVKELRGNRAYLKLAAIAQAIVSTYQRKFLHVKPWGVLARTMREVTFRVGGKNRDRWGNSAAAVLPGL